MKVKMGFVTNSSSTSYLIFVPDGFELTKFVHLVDDDFKEMFLEEEDEDDPEMTYESYIQGIFNKLKESGTIDEYDQRLAYYGLIEIFRNLELVVHTWDGGPDSGILIDLNSIKMIKDVRRITGGGWGVKHGGWGSTSETGGNV